MLTSSNMNPDDATSCIFHPKRQKTMRCLAIPLPQENKMKLSLIGSRGHVQYVFDSLPVLPQVTLAGVTTGCKGDSRDDLNTLLTTAGLAATWHDDWQEMLDTEKPDIVSIDGPFEDHAKMCVAALERGIHVFCEKPIALNLADLDAVEAAWRKSGAKIISMVGLRYDAAFYHAWSLIRAGAIGDIRIVSTRKSYKLGTRPAFYRERATYGGTIPWVGSHAFDWILWFTQANFVSVSAMHSAEANGGNGDMEIAAVCQMKLNNGAFAQASIDLLRPNDAATHGDDRIRLAGSHGVLEVADGVVRLTDSTGEHLITPLPCPKAIFRDFVNEIEGKTKCLVTAEETFALTRAVLLAREAADTGKTIFF